MRHDLASIALMLLFAALLVAGARWGVIHVR